jgi:hypothetical protein
MSLKFQILLFVLIVGVQMTKAKKDIMPGAPMQQDPEAENNKVRALQELLIFLIFRSLRMRLLQSTTKTIQTTAKF